jgi:hypothetical protein
MSQLVRISDHVDRLRADIDPVASAGLILSAAWGLVSHIFASTHELDAAARQLRSWLLPVK